MRSTRTSRSISIPIILGSITVALSVFLLVGWTYLLVRNPDVTSQVRHNRWLLVTGIMSFLVIMTVLVIFIIFLVREINEVRRQDSFIDSVTHELKSPLASLKLCLQTMARPEVQPTQRAALEQMMADDIERLTVFIDDILEASRITHRRRSYSLSDVPLGALVAKCKESVMHRYKLEEGAITVDVPDGLVLATDRTALETIIKNLLDNAIKYSNPPVRIAVRATRTGERAISLAVRDEGIGIPEQHLGRIFQRFFRVPEEAVRTRPGTGLGLFVVSALVRSLGGRIEVSSPGAGRGTTVAFSLPLGAKPPKEPA